MCFTRLRLLSSSSPFFFFNDTATTEIYTLSLHDALPIWFDHATHAWLDHALRIDFIGGVDRAAVELDLDSARRSEEHTSELQSPCKLVCRLLLEKKKKNEAIPRL